jgi:Ca2+-binding EF-hand superfamily protein
MKTKTNTHWAAIATIILACTGLLQGQEKQQPRSDRGNDNPRAQDNRRPALRDSARLPSRDNSAGNSNERRPRRGTTPSRRPEGGNSGGSASILQVLDYNRDGKLQQGEIDMAVVILRRMDRNQDGEISSGELSGASNRSGGFAGRPNDRPPGNPGTGGQSRGRVPQFADLDKNGDGKITKDEAPERMAEHFEEHDTNSDGFIDKKEQDAVIEFIRQRFSQRNRSDQDRGLTFEQMDTNKDGKISKDEAPERMAERFGEVDSNSDGFIDKEEQAVVVEAIRRRSGQGQGQRNRPDPNAGQGGADKPKRPPLDK